MLPKVKKEIVESTTESITQDKAQFVKEKILEIKVDNPVLFTILNTIAERKDWSAKEKNCYILGAVQFYMFLSMQDECNQMQEDYPI